MPRLLPSRQKTEHSVAPASAAARVPVQTGYIIACGVCELAGGPFAAEAEAELLARTHDQVHHRSRGTAEISAASSNGGKRYHP